MNKTKHLVKRQCQRGISDYLLNIIEENGKYRRVPGGGIKIHLGNREYQNIVHETKRFLQVLDKAKGGTIIIHDSDMLTVYKYN
ncbi:MAG: hypothetical protein Q8K02_08095 [Flavobacterium sp.]|nr:hypothetical protein [Flavobacterium sp.]